MELKINLPFSEWSYKISGVYRILFEDGFFYIGCSNHLRRRSGQWECVFNSPAKYNPGIKIGTSVSNKINEGKKAVFEIVELCSVEDLKDKESFYLEKYMDDSKMLSDADRGSWKTVLQYNKDGVFIKKHFSISGAAKYNGFRLSAVQRILYGERGSHRGMVFIFEHEYHSRRKEIIRARYKTTERKQGRNVIALNVDGSFVKEYKRIIDAAKDLSCNEKAIRRVLSGHQHVTNGFIFKYSENRNPRYVDKSKSEKGPPSCRDKKGEGRTPFV